jgi:FkbM family methyltransferase
MFREMIIDQLKLFIRLLEARMTPRKANLRFNGHDIRAIRSLWWYDGEQQIFDAEIAPYFQTLVPSVEGLVIVDAGAACGLFSMAAGFFFPAARIWAFEPSERQRILLARNLNLNSMAGRIRIAPFGLWNCEDRMVFRTQGAMSSLRKASELPNYLAFTESVQTVTLDIWAKRSKLQRLDLIKMDIEGAEIEALEGAAEVLRRYHPRLLIQAYHQRDGMRTFERCARYLIKFGYQCRELKPQGGLMDAAIDHCKCNPAKFRGSVVQ